MCFSLQRQQFNQPWNLSCSQPCCFLFFFKEKKNMKSTLLTNKHTHTHKKKSKETKRPWPLAAVIPLLWRMATHRDSSSLCMLYRMCSARHANCMHLSVWRTENGCMPCMQDCEIFTNWLHQRAKWKGGGAEREENWAGILLKIFTEFFSSLWIG